MDEIQYIARAIHLNNFAREVTFSESSSPYPNKTVEEIISKAYNGLNKFQIKEMLNFLLDNEYLQIYNGKPFKREEHSVTQILAKKYIK